MINDVYNTTISEYSGETCSDIIFVKDNNC